MNETENPPAFPVELSFGLEPGEPSQTGESKAQFPGMTLRDWFAGQALTGFIAACASFSEIRDDETCAIRAYAMADAMLEERAK